jgi:hypothetical protein
MVSALAIQAWAKRPDVRELLAKGSRLFRVHPTCYPANLFNPNLGSGEGRFHPVMNAFGLPVPTLYAAHSMEGAFGEVLFRHGTVNFPQKRAQEYSLSEIELCKDVYLASLKGTRLRALGLSRSDVLENTDYTQSRLLATDIHHALAVDGLIWLSKQNDEAQNVVLFEPTVLATDLKVIHSIELSSDHGLRLLCAAANEYNISLVI